jgi:hypothetical protein
MSGGAGVESVGLDASVARRVWSCLEPYHTMIYSVPETVPAYAAIGIDNRPMGYFATRAAALGPVPAEVVIALFYNFWHASVIRAAIPEAWRRASREQLVAARRSAADAALRRLLGPAAASREMEEAAELARRAAGACSLAGRPMYAAHSTLPWPAEPHMALWHAQTLLREFRYDGHVHALAAAGLSGIEALVTYEATGAVPKGVLKETRGWSDRDWAAAVRGLQERGWLAGDGSLSEEGRARREALERRTDELALAPWLRLGEEGCERLIELARPFSQAIVDAGTFPIRPSYLGA